MVNYGEGGLEFSTQKLAKALRPAVNVGPSNANEQVIICQSKLKQKKDIGMLFIPIRVTKIMLPAI